MVLHSQPAHDNAGIDLDEVRRLHEAFLRAITDEIDEMENGRRSGVVLSGSGVLQHMDVPGSWYYKFEGHVRTGGLRAGASIGFETADALHEGTVREYSDRHLLVAFSDDLGTSTPAGRLIIDNRWLLASLARRIQLIDEYARSSCRSSHFDLTSALRIVGAGDLSIPPANTAPIPLNPALNAEQRQFVTLGHNAPAVYLWGPAGTGKTQSLLALILSLLRDGRRVLYVTPTNTTVDDLIERGAEDFRRAPWAQDGAVLRMGPADSITLKVAHRDEYCISSVVRRRLGDSIQDYGAYNLEAARVIQSSRLVCTTIHQTWLSPLLADMSWDVLVVDEASMISPVALYAASVLASRTVVAGDFRQLPPVVLSNTLDARTWLRRDAFEVVGIPDDVERGDYPEYLVMLRMQYRMAPAICDLAARAYDHQLITDQSVLDRGLGSLGGHAVMYVDSSELDAMVEVERSGSRLNSRHAAITVALLERMVARQALTQQDLQDLLVITPFVAQARLLEAQLRSRFGRRAPVVRTIHRCQGREADIVVLDLVDAYNERPSQFFSGHGLTSESARLLTVAITRAREHLIVLGDMEHMQSSMGVGRFARGLMSDLVAHGRRLRLDLRDRRRPAA
jgi:hypothetical protein